ncbi:hypothetical protein SFUMM280S_07898 [Streptomyces fumanus]
MATSRASSAGFQKPALSVNVPSLGRSVASAAATSAGKGAGMPKWSGTRITSYPSSSARRHLARHSPADTSSSRLTPKRNGRDMNSPHTKAT